MRIAENAGPKKVAKIAIWFQRYCTCTVLQQWTSAKLCGVEQRASPIFGRAAITLGRGPHSSACLIFYVPFSRSLEFWKRFLTQVSPVS